MQQIEASMQDKDRLRLDRQLCFALYQASNLMTRLYAPYLQDMSITYPQYLVMLALWTEQPRSVGDLGAELGLNFGTLSPLLKRMESKGLLLRSRDPSDERKVGISLTEKGESLRAQALAMQSALRCDIELSDETLTQLRLGIQSLIDTISTNHATQSPQTKGEHP